MPTAIHAELTASGDRIVLIAAGPVEDVAFAAKQLQQVTPLVKPTQPAGGLVLPLSWPAVVQLSSVYRDGWRPGGWWKLPLTVRRIAGHALHSPYFPIQGIRARSWSAADSTARSPASTNAGPPWKFVSGMGGVRTRIGTSASRRHISPKLRCRAS